MIPIIHHFDERTYDADLGAGASSTEIVFKYYQDRSYDPKNLFVSFTQKDKIGINPQTKYDTPVGIYAYPVEELFEDNVDPDHYNLKLGSFVPFAGQQPWVTLFQPRNPDKVIQDIADQHTYTQNDLLRDLQVLYEEFLLPDEKLSNSLPFRRSEEMIDWADKFARYPQVPGGILWAAIWKLSQRLDAYWNFRSKPKTIFTKMLITLGYDGVANRSYPPIIHQSEPQQAVFFGRNVIDVIQRIPNEHRSRAKEYKRVHQFLNDLKSLSAEGLILEYKHVFGGDKLVVDFITDNLNMQDYTFDMLLSSYAKTMIREEIVNDIMHEWALGIAAAEEKAKDVMQKFLSATPEDSLTEYPPVAVEYALNSKYWDEKAAAQVLKYFAEHPHIREQDKINLLARVKDDI